MDIKQITRIDIHNHLIIIENGHSLLVRAVLVSIAICRSHYNATRFSCLFVVMLCWYIEAIIIGKSDGVFEQHNLRNQVDVIAEAILTASFGLSVLQIAISLRRAP